MKLTIKEVVITFTEKRQILTKKKCELFSHTSFLILLSNLEGKRCFYITLKRTYISACTLFELFMKFQNKLYVQMSL